MGLWDTIKNPFVGADPYNSRSNPYARGSIQNFNLLNQYGNPAQQQALQNLLQMLQSQGRVDPRLLASAQTQNARSTQQQQDAARAGAARNGLGGGGLNQAILAALGSAGATRSANLNYQDIADSYGRNQQNIGLLSSLVTQPQLGYASLSADLYKSKAEADAKQKAAQLAMIGQSMESVGSAFGGGMGG